LRSSFPGAKSRERAVANDIEVDIVAEVRHKHGFRPTRKEEQL
jgi:hypothetical protein